MSCWAHPLPSITSARNQNNSLPSPVIRGRADANFYVTTIDVYASMWHERTISPRPALSVRQLSPYLAGSHPALRKRTSAVWHASYAVHRPASTGADRRSVSTEAGRNTGDGQHKPDPHAGNHAPPRLDPGAAGQRPAGTIATAGERGAKTTRACLAGMGEGSITATAPVGRAGLEQPFPTHA